KNLFISCAVLILSLTSCSNDDKEMKDKELVLVTSSNTSGKVTYVDLLEPSAMVKSFTIASLDAEGISYNPDTDAITVASRTNNRLESYSDVKAAAASGAIALTASLSSSNLDFTNARE